MKDFKRLKVWQHGMEIAQLCYELIREFPKEEKYGLISQITRSASSIPANIAEGSSRKSDREYAHFLQISLGSCFELETHILLSELLGFGLINIRKSILYKIDEEQKMLISFINKLNKQSS